MTPGFRKAVHACCLVLNVGCIVTLPNSPTVPMHVVVALFAFIWLLAEYRPEVS